MHFPIRVYYEDTDAGGVVYHANYICFFERARTEFLRQGGFSQQALLADNFAFVVKTLTIDYKLPARLDDLLSVQTMVKAVKKATIIFEQNLFKADICLCSAEVTVASVDLIKMKPKAIPQAILDALQAVINQ
ncbi:tol-pal system-associated acyl-CoA thioesterase [Haemophilus sputorum]